MPGQSSALEVPECVKTAVHRAATNCETGIFAIGVIASTIAAVAASIAILVIFSPAMAKQKLQSLLKGDVR